MPPPGSLPTDDAWARYYEALVAWSWSTWEACKPVAE